MTILDAARKWVGEFNAIPGGVIEKLMELDPDDVIEVTPICEGDRVYGDGINDGEVLSVDYGIASVQTNDGEVVCADVEKLTAERYDALPIWGTLWSFGDGIDREWAEVHLQEIAECGFRIYEQEDYGYIFGIDGAGYDFYESHWIPLYKARGLRWHY